MPAAQREHHLDTLALEHLRHQQPAVEDHLVHSSRLISTPARHLARTSQHVRIASIPRTVARIPLRAGQ